MPRELRHPLDEAGFNRLELVPVTKSVSTAWWNLRWAVHDKPGSQFFATASGRLTPISMKVPCLYLAQNRETSFYELYGDVIDAAQKTGLTPTFGQQELMARVYLKTIEPFSVKVYDLTASRSAKKIGMDLGTLYSADINYPREFAQRLHDHPASFDGIQYVSRHTQALCLVLWATHTPTFRTLPLERGSSLWDLTHVDRHLPPGSLRLFDAAIQVASTP
jgi:hypothetical protein